jgi:hypothetical protein
MSNICVIKSILLFVLVLVVFGIIYTYNNSGPSATTTTIAQISNLQRKLNLLERFLDVNLKKLQTPDTQFASMSADGILEDYSKLLTPNFINNIRSSGTTATFEYSNNNTQMSTNLNTLDNNLKPILDYVNTKLYDQLGKNYARSQQINSIREDALQNINELPYMALQH